VAKIVVLGAGVMGSAFTTPLAHNGHSVQLVGTHLDGDIIEELHESGVHPRLKSRLNPSVRPLTIDRLDEALEDADLVVLGVNSNGVSWAADMLGPRLPAETPLLFLTKGLAPGGDGLLTLPHKLREQLPAGLREQVRLNAVGGPSIAGELSELRHTCVVVTGSDGPFLETLAGYLRTPYYHVWTSTDLIGVETCVAMKNVYALAVGLVGGLLENEGVAPNGAVMFNVAAGLFAQGLWEIAYMVQWMGGDPRSVYSLPGAGDLYVTSMGGRNARMGRHLAMGTPYSVAKASYMAEETIEGAQLVQAIGPAVERLVAEGRMDGDAIPLLRTMGRIVNDDAPVDLPWDTFFSGPLKSAAPLPVVARA
jgi:glycerol-3-phosphate dehydrogenase (NAD(P)+)